MHRDRKTALPRAILLAPTDGGLALARSLRRRGVQLAMVAEGRMPWAGRTWGADRYRLGQLPGDRERWLDCLSNLAAGGDGVLIPGTDRLSEFLARERGLISPRLRSFERPDGAHSRLMNKASLYEAAADAGVRCPWVLRLCSRAELDDVAAKASYPCLLKPALSHQWRRQIGDRRAILLNNPAELAAEAGLPLDHGLELLVTEHIPGPDRNLEGAVTVRGEDGSEAVSYGLRKLRSYPPGFGTGTVHESADVPETHTLAARLLDSVGFTGVSHVETKRHAASGELVLIEVNVRLPRSWGLADASGTDGSWRLYSSLAGIELATQRPARPGVRSITPSLEPKAAVAGLARRRMTLRELLGSYRGVRDLSGLSPLDPGPVVVLAARQTRSLGRRICRGVGRRK